MKKKQKKSKEEKIAEEYFPIEKDNLKYAVEKLIKEIPEIETIEKIAKIKSVKKTRKKSSTPKKTKIPKEKKYEPPEINLKKDGYELIVTEKPQAAMKIASALGKATKKSIKGVPYYELNKDGKRIVVGCAVGHLFTLKQNANGSAVPIFDIRWVPNFLVKKKDFSKKYYENLLTLAKNAGSLTDYDIEGEVIGLNIIRFICGQKDASRMKFSTLTEKELNLSYENKSPTINWGQAIAGETRHYLDWFYGINLSRALMNAIKTTGKFKIMSIGRVQGPALNLIVKKEKEIQAFKSSFYWQVFIKVKNSHELELKYNKDIIKESDLKKFENLVGKTAEAETKKTKQIIPPNPPFNLTALQIEAYKLFGIIPSKTLQIAQSLYLNGLISYPRTSSQKLPESIDYHEILKKLAKEYNAEKLITRKKPVEGGKSDPAHPSIYPTGNRQILSGEDEKIYNLIAKRFLSLFCDDAVLDNKTIKVEIDNLIFSTRGSSIIKKGWTEIYPVKMKENEIPDLNGEIKITKIRNEKKETQPPKRYSPASIVSELEKRNLGTKATRASIIETLYDRGYVKEKSIEATPLGISLIETLEKYSPIITDEKLTRDFEIEMNNIIKAKKNFVEKEEKVIEEAKNTIKKIAKNFEESEKKIGEELTKANEDLREQEKIANIITQCPKCKSGNLAITYSRKNRRQFIACNAYPECKNTYSLPPNSLIKKSDKICEQCNFPMLMSIKKGKRPWIFCFNPECPTNKERMEKYRKEKEREGN